jgi:hypothetical protein
MDGEHHVEQGRHAGIPKCSDSIDQIAERHLAMGDGTGDHPAGAPDDFAGRHVVGQPHTQRKRIHPIIHGFALVVSAPQGDR